jgi:ATP-dependent DNA helicase RecQ
LLFRGKDSLTEEAFRSDYGRLAELWSLVHKNVPFIALTATATEATRKTIIKDLCMRDCVQILGDPNKQNIRYTIKDVDHKNLYDTFKPIINELEEKQVNTTKVMVFCRRKEHVKELFELFTQCLGQKAYYRPTGEEPIDDRSRLFAMYHKKTHSLVKKTVETEFCKENGTVRVVFCTIAFGMGVNVKGGNVVIHLGPSGGLDDYLQESGRVGRDKANAHAILLKYKGCTCSRNITKQMKEYVRNTTECRRVLLLKPFVSNPQPNAICFILAVIYVQASVSVCAYVLIKNSVLVLIHAIRVITSPCLKTC